jgi:hypothetical protein
MTRRSSIFALGTIGLLTVAAFACGPRLVPPYIEIRIASGAGPIAIEEFVTIGHGYGARSQSAGALQASDERGLALFLGRSLKDPAAPKVFHLTVNDGCSLERVWAAVRAAKAAGVTQVRYFGCLPPGCGQLTGANGNQERLSGTVYKIEDLVQILETVSTYC